MPWRETCVVDERVRFIAALREAEEPFAVICKRFEISRKTATSGWRATRRADLLRSSTASRCRGGADTRRPAR
jgi:hypothetical protein